MACLASMHMMNDVQVLERGLEGKQWLAGGSYSIADIANFSWVIFAYGLGESIQLACLPPELPHTVSAVLSRDCRDAAVATVAELPLGSRLWLCFEMQPRHEL